MTMRETDKVFVETLKDTFGDGNVNVVNNADQAISDLAKREARRKYQREWRKNNPEKVRAQNERYWQKKGQEYIESFSKSPHTPSKNNLSELPQAAKNQLAIGYERLIEFRGRKCGDVPWVYGDLYQYLNGAKGIRPYGKMQPISVLRNTIGQYIGCIDKKGQKIFEGDIVNMSLNGLTIRVVVKFCNGAFVLFAKKNGDSHVFPFVLTKNAEYEVIGNIHDNPELMEGN